MWGWLVSLGVRAGSLLWRMVNSRLALIGGAAFLANRMMPETRDERPRSPSLPERNVRPKQWYTIRLGFLIPQDLDRIVAGTDRALGRFRYPAICGPTDPSCLGPPYKYVRKFHVLKGSLIGGVEKVAVDFAFIDPLDPAATPTLGQVAQAIARETGGALSEIATLSYQWPQSPPDLPDAPLGFSIDLETPLTILAGGVAASLVLPKVIHELKQERTESSKQGGD